MSNNWNARATNRQTRLARAAERLGSRLQGKHTTADSIVDLLTSVIEPGDRVCLEGNNQKQADFLARALTSLDPAVVHDLHMVQSVLALPEHLDVFEKGIASKLDFSFSGPQGARLARLASSGQIAIGAIHTYLELFARYFVDLTPNVALICAQAADREGNLYTGGNTEDTPAIVEATAFRSGIVVAQVNEVVDTLPRVDIPADWVNYVIQSPTPHFIEPLFTRDPSQISEIQVLMAMMAIKGIYAEYGVQRLNHGIGFDTAAIELLLPTYGESLGLKGRICRHWALNPHPALIPAIEAGWVESVHSFGSEVGMENYVRARPDVFFTGARRQHAQQPRVLPGGRALRLRSVHRLHAADRPGGQQLHRNAGPHCRFRRRAEHGRRRARPPARQRAVAQGRAASAARGFPARPRRRAGRSWWCRWSRPSASTCSPPSSSDWTRGRLPSRRACRCRRS